MGAVLAVATEPGERLPADWSPSRAVGRCRAAGRLCARPRPCRPKPPIPNPDQVRPSAPELQASWKARAHGPPGRPGPADCDRQRASAAVSSLRTSPKSWPPVQQIDSHPRDGAATPVAANLAAGPGAGPGPGAQAPVPADASVRRTCWPATARADPGRCAWLWITGGTCDRGCPW